MNIVIFKMLVPNPDTANNWSCAKKKDLDGLIAELVIKLIY